MKNCTRIALFASLPALTLGVLPAAPAQAQPAPFTIAETGQDFATLQQAVDAIGDGSGTIAISSGTYRQCAVQERGSIAYLAATPGSVIFDGVTCEGKAALVLRGRSAEVSGITFRRMAVPDFNGSGIRLEQGDLTVAQSWFTDSQQGILAGDNPAGRIVIDKSTFSGLGNCEDPSGCAHSVYLGVYGHVRITRSRFERGAGGHYVKVRAKRVDIASSSFDDSAGRGTNYMIDLPNGATGQITNNWFVQGQDKENYSALIAVGAENRTNSSNGLTIAGNDARFAPKLRRNSSFVADWTGDKITIADNQLGAGLKKYEKR